MTLKVLFYVEPVVFRDDPLMLSAWIDIIRRIADVCPELKIQLISSNILCECAHGNVYDIFRINSGELIEEFGFDRRLYIEDIFYGDSSKNSALIRGLTSARDNFDPDVVISWTENVYIRRIFSDRPILWTELGPLPRTFLRMSIHFDPFGHQLNSVFDRFTAPIWDIERYAPLLSAWNEKVMLPLRHEAQTRGVSEWLAGLPSTGPRILLPLQPSDWLTYEGAGVSVDPLSLVRRVSTQAGPDAIVIPQWHQAQKLPGEPALQELRESHPNIFVPPANIRSGQSELFLDEVDEVVAVSSNLIVTASIIGRPVSVLGNCKFSSLDSKSQSNPGARPDLIGLLMGGYCQTVDRCTGEAGTFSSHVQSLINQPERLFTERLISNTDFLEFVA